MWNGEILEFENGVLKMEIESYDGLWECHECADKNVKCKFIWFDNLCQHFVSLCIEKCYPKLKKLISSRDRNVKE